MRRPSCFPLSIPPSRLRRATVPQFSMVVPLRSQARLWLSLLHWAYYGLFPPLAAASVRPCASLARCSVSSHRPRLTAARCSGAADALWACPRASSRFAAFDCALRVLATSALRAFTFLQAFALLKMPEMTYMPSFLIRASFFRYFVNTLCQRS